MQIETNLRRTACGSSSCVVTGPSPEVTGDLDLARSTEVLYERRRQSLKAPQGDEIWSTRSSPLKVLSSPSAIA